MATYKSINGYRVQSLSADPTYPKQGQVWYNTTTGLLKYRAVSSTKTVTTS